ncbi:septum formation initiator family protein [Bacteroidales bacterium OttesenSCG-928-A17]|nr:septum formation initiator family protein [Bacteroidales bacterium OttesenSCG-928-A17]
MRNFFDKIQRLLSKVNKYWLTVIIFLVITFFIGDSTIMHRISYDRQIIDLENQIDQISREREGNLEKLESLQSDNETLERFAREEFQMTKPNEELFLIVE